MKMTVDELAEKLGKNRATIYRYEGNEIENMPVSILEPLAKALHVTPAYLLGWEESDDKINTIAAHHDGDDWTEEELAEIERFKEFLRMKRKLKEQEEQQMEKPE